jgi:hypothetical protein
LSRGKNDFFKKHLQYSKALRYNLNQELPLGIDKGIKSGYNNP